MRVLLRSGGIGLVLLGEILREENAKKQLLVQCNLSTEEGVHKALGLQHEIKGMDRVIDLIFEIAEGKDND